MVWSLELEDIHTHIERALQKRIGAAAGRLHTGRSRNDQVATDVRLYLTQEAAVRLRASLREVMKALVVQARAHEGAILPGTVIPNTATLNPTMHIGDKAPDFTLPDQEGKASTWLRTLV